MYNFNQKRVYKVIVINKGYVAAAFLWCLVKAKDENIKLWSLVKESRDRWRQKEQNFTATPTLIEPPLT